MPLQDRI